MPIDAYRVSFAAELSTKLVSNSVFVKDYDYILYLLLLWYIYITKTKQVYLKKN